jgi:pyruvate dehydrogenase E2 component (dihydrolipoamide acetyltransferase)
MPTDVIMPQMGESIFEGTLTKWLKKPGDKIQRDEPLFEISTDKVDAEIPAPASGVLKEIKVQEGTTVQVNTVVGIIDAEGAAAAPAPPQPARPAATQRSAATDGPSKTPAAARSGGNGRTGAPAASPSPVGETEVDTTRRPGGDVNPAAHASEQRAVQQQQATVTTFAPAGDGGRIRSSPLVRKIAKDNQVDLRQVSGSGLGGRITKDDILGFLQQHGGGGRPAAAVQAPPQAPAYQPPQPSYQPAPQPSYQPAQAAAPAPPMQMPAPTPGELVPMSKMRTIIAQRMPESKHISAHVHTVFKVDMTRIVKLREREKNKFEQRNGVKLTYMPFIARAVIAGIKAMPIVNSSVEGESIRYHKNVNLGIAVALDWGLIVPVVKQAEERSFLGLQRAINDVAERARNKKLQPDEVQGGTFTITNPGIFGPQFGTPIINQPQVAILGMGGLFKEPVVITDESANDSIAIRSIIRLTLGYDHRIIDGADADKFMVAVKKYLENWSEEIG